MSPLHVRRLTDEHLGSRLASGEAAAFDELYRRYVHRLAAYGAQLLGDAAAGDDVAQSTLLKAYSALREGRLPERMRPWLYRIAHNTALDLFARRRELPSADLPERTAQSAPETGALVAALAALPERQRRVYVLRELHGLRIDETAAELGLVASQVEQSLFAARNRLAEHLVFGDRLDCVAVRRLSAGPLDGDERRGLKTHLRSCPACRSELGLRGRVVSALPLASVDWVRGLLTGLVGGGAPAAAKLTAVVATAGIAAGVPGAVETPRRDVQRPHARVHAVTKPVAQRSTRTAVASSPPVSRHFPVPVVLHGSEVVSQPVRTGNRQRGERTGSSSRSDDRSDDRTAGSGKHGAVETTDGHAASVEHETTTAVTTEPDGEPPGSTVSGDSGHVVESTSPSTGEDGGGGGTGDEARVNDGTGHDGAGSGEVPEPPNTGAPD